MPKSRARLHINAAEMNGKVIAAENARFSSLAERQTALMGPEFYKFLISISVAMTVDCWFLNARIIYRTNFKCRD